MPARRCLLDDARLLGRIAMIHRTVYDVPPGSTHQPAISGLRGRNMIAEHLVTTAFELPGCRILANHGIVRGIVVRSRSVVGNFAAGLQTLFGGNITIYTELCERARREAYDLMLRHAAERGANAVIGARYDANEVMPGVTEVLAYGTAVTVAQLG